MSTNGDNRVAKRQRVDAEIDESNTPRQPKIEIEEAPGRPESAYRHHKKYWYRDGNLVVVARSGPSPTAFKVFRSVLADNSPVLAERLTHTDEAASYGGCPVLSLDETADEVEALLLWLFSKAFGLSLPKQMCYEHVCAFYRLGLEYGLEDMREEAVWRLKICFPQSLDDYEKRDEDDSPDRPITFTTFQELDLAVFCAVHSLQSLVSPLLYECCSYGPASLEGDGAFVSKLPLITIEGQSPQQWLNMRIMRGYLALCTARADRIRMLLAVDLSHSCATPVQCREALNTVAGMLLGGRTADGVLPKDTLSLEESYQNGIRPCAACWKFHVKLWDTERRKTWDNLSTIFGLFDAEAEVT